MGLAHMFYGDNYNYLEEVAHLADVNGDGLPDIIQAGSQGSGVWLNNGSGWTKSALYSIPFGGLDSSKGARVVDVNGDGLADVVISSPNTNTAYLNNGKGWTVCLQLYIKAAHLRRMQLWWT
jgi:hypothetical protein